MQIGLDVEIATGGLLETLDAETFAPASGGTTVSTASAVSTWTVPTVTPTLGGISATVAPATATWTLPAVSPTVGNVNAAPAPAIATWTVPAVAPTEGGISASTTPATATWVVPAVTPTLGGVSAAPAPAVSTWEVPAVTPGGSGPQVADPLPSVSTWVVPTITPTLGGISATVAPAVSSWTVNPVTPAVGGITVSVAPATSSWSTPAVTPSLGNVAASLGPAIMTWAVPSVTITIGGGAVAVTLSAISAWVVPTVSIPNPVAISVIGPLTRIRPAVVFTRVRPAAPLTRVRPAVQFTPIRPAVSFTRVTPDYVPPETDDVMPIQRSDLLLEFIPSRDDATATKAGTPTLRPDLNGYDFGAGDGIVLDRALMDRVLNEGPLGFTILVAVQAVAGLVGTNYTLLSYTDPSVDGAVFLSLVQGADGAHVRLSAGLSYNPSDYEGVDDAGAIALGPHVVGLRLVRTAPIGSRVSLWLDGQQITGAPYDPSGSVDPDTLAGTIDTYGDGTVSLGDDPNSAAAPNSPAGSVFGWKAPLSDIAIASATGWVAAAYPVGP